MREGAGGEALPVGEFESTRGHRSQHVAVVGGIDDHSNVGVILGRGPHHGRSTDVDLFDAFLGAGTRGDRLGEGVEVHDHELERLNAQFGQLTVVFFVAQVGE